MSRNALPALVANLPIDRTELLAKLEERFIMGEISEEAYEQLVEKYSGEEPVIRSSCCMIG